MILGLSGNIASGKTTAAKYIHEKFGFENLSTRNLLTSVLLSQNRSVTRENLQSLGSDLVRLVGPGGFIALMLEYLPEGNYVIDAIRFPEAVDYLRGRFPKTYFHLHITASDSIRLGRMKMKEDLKESKNMDVVENAETEQGNDELLRRADLTIMNDGSMQDFYIHLNHIDILGQK